MMIGILDTSTYQILLFIKIVCLIHDNLKVKFKIDFGCWLLKKRN